MSVQYYPCIFTIQKIDSELVRFETELVPIKTVEDLDILGSMKLRARHCDGKIYSVKLSEANILIINELLKDMCNSNDFQKETNLYLILNKEWNLLKIF